MSLLVVGGTGMAIWRGIDIPEFWPPIVTAVVMFYFRQSE